MQLNPHQPTYPSSNLEPGLPLLIGTSTGGRSDNLNTDVQPTNAEAEALLAAELARAATLLQEHGTAFRQLVRQLLADGAVPAATFGQVTGLAVRVDDAQGDANGPEPWHARWEAFAGN